MRKTAIVVIIALLAFSAVAYAGLFGDLANLGKPKYTCIRAPEKVMEGVKNLGVEDFRGSAGDALATALIEALTSANRTGPEPAGDAIEAMASGLVEGAASQATGGLSQIVTGTVSAVADLGKAPLYEKGLRINVFESIKKGRESVDAFITGEMETVGPKDSRYKTTTVVITGDGKKTKKNISCTKREAKLTVHMKVMKEDNIHYSKDMATDTVVTKCEGEQRNLPSSDEMFTAMAKQLAPHMANCIAPYYNTIAINLQKDKATKKAVKIASKDRDWDKAVAIWKNVLTADEYNYSALYNLGVANQIFGNYDKAVEYFEKAEAASSHKRNKKAIMIVKARKTEIERLKGYGLISEVHAFADVAPTTMVVSLKGNSKKRYDLMEKPDASSSVVAKLPGGMIVAIVGTEGDWTKIKTKDGKEGYVTKKSLKIKK